MRLFSKDWFSYNRRYRFDRGCQFKKWSYDWDDYVRTLHKRSLMPTAIGATAIAWIARALSERLVADRGDRTDNGDYMRTSLNRSQRTSKCGKNISDTLGCASCATFLFLPHFDVICDLLVNRRTVTWNLFVKYFTKCTFSAPRNLRHILRHSIELIEL